MNIVLVTLIVILLILAIYLYCQNYNLKINLDKEKKNKIERDSFLITLIHDLKTPTYAQFNTFNMLKNEVIGNINYEQKKIISIALDSCQYMFNLINTITEIYHQDSCNIKLNKCNFDIGELAMSLCQEMNILSKNKKQKIIFNNTCNNNFIYADKLQIKRVILNLLSNAINYGFNETNINVVLRGDTNYIEFYVQNISKQIPQKELFTIFEKFKKTQYSMNNKFGSGLGLYLVKTIIEHHQGRVFAKSDNDGCCTFGFVIPNKAHLHLNKCKTR